MRAAVLLTAIATLGCASGARVAPEAGGAPSTSELGVLDTRVGTGARAAAHQCLSVHYVGMLPDGRRFESSRDTLPNGRTPPPITFELGAGVVMRGWDQGLVGMRVGGMRRLFVPYRLAYGANGRPPAIPPRTDLVFDVELLAAAARTAMGCESK